MWRELSGLALGGLGSGTTWQAMQESNGRTQRQAVRDEAERARADARHLCFSLLESLTGAMEAISPDNVGHLETVQRVSEALARALALPDEERDALRAAALLHSVGRLGVPESIFQSVDALTQEEQEKLQTHPMLGARIIAAIPFPWPVVPLVRHHAEHWDGSGYPDALRGTEIPLGARILALANAYSALLRPRSYRPAFAPADAIAEIEAGAGTRFDPGVVVAFREIAAQLRAEAEAAQRHAEASAVPDALEQGNEATFSATSGKEPGQTAAQNALRDIARAKRETQSLARLAQLIGASLHMEAIAEAVLSSVRELVPCVTAALFLPEANANEGEWLCGVAAQGANARRFLGSTARIGTYITGRAFCRGEIKTAPFMLDDVLLRDVSEAWTPLRSCLVVPLMVGSVCLGTLNLYSDSPDAFGSESHRILRLVAAQAARAVENAASYARAHENSLTDALTGLRNARYLRDFLDREMNRAQRDELPLAVLNIDLNNFKPINDRFGHARGDMILREVATILHDSIRSYDLAARYAGDEFVVVLPKSGPVQAQIIADKLKAAVAKHSARLRAREPEFPELGISLGIAVYPDTAADAHELLCRSDAAMYADKVNRVAARPS